METIDHLTQDENNFLDKIKHTYENVVGYESYGDTIEFYDEDGVVLMLAHNLADNKIMFTFTDDNSDFEYSLNDKNIGNLVDKL